MVETFADVLKGVGEGPADTDGFLGKAKRGIIENPAELVGEEKGRDVLVAVDGGRREDDHMIADLGVCQLSVVCCQWFF